MKNKSNPSRIVQWLMLKFIPPEERIYLEQAMLEVYNNLCTTKGRGVAGLWFLRQLVRSLPALLLNSIYWSFQMFANDMKITLRNLKKNKIYSFINISGLAIGLACCILILLWVQDELSYDRFHENAKSLYIATFSNGSIVTPTALSGFLKEEYPEILHTSRFINIGDNLLKYKDIEINEDYGIMVDPGFLKMFTIPFTSGNPDTALNDPDSIVISQTLAHKYFGNKDPLGETMTFSASYELKITGVFKDYPANSHIECAYILPVAFAKNWSMSLNTWDVNNIQTYVQLQAGLLSQSVDKKIKDVVERHRPQDQRALHLQPITRLHLNPYNDTGGTLVYVYLFSSLALFILLIACINFINLTTAKSSTRGKEVGIRKTVGAWKATLIRQFFGESLVFTALASFAGIGLVILFLPMFNNLSGKAFVWEFLFQQKIAIGIFGIILFTGIIAGIYPAFLLSRFQPAKVMKGQFKIGIKGGLFRKALVVVQFSLSVLLILGTLIIFRQVHFLRERSVGYDRENIVIFEIGSRFRENIERIKTELLSNPDVLNITLVNVAPYRWNSNAGYGDVHWEGKTHQQVKMVMTSVDYDFLKTFKLQMAEGRFFSKEYSTDISEAYVVNQAAVRAMELEDPIGKELTVRDSSRRIIGVIRDYNFESLHNEIIPMTLMIEPNGHFQACVRITPHRVPETLAFLEEKWKEIYPEYPFEYAFLDDAIQSRYRSEQTTGTIVSIFTLLAIFISCLGIFGLSSFTAEQRTKEIGIRKILGASVMSIVRYISREFVMLVIIANIIMWPMAYFILKRWLENYAYRTDIAWWIFVLTGLSILMVSLLTVSWQIIRAATTNPVDSLRYE
ncbi:MAG: ABC transporter permease [Candidatus Aminicenantes bacterium]